MNIYIKSNQEVRSWYDKDSYPEFADKLDDAYRIDWNINMEDIECIMSDDIDLSNVKSVRYFDESEMAACQDAGYEGGYVFKYNSGLKKMFAWLPYPHNLDGMDEVEFIYSKQMRVV